MKETVLVTGGAGYIGSHTVHYLLEKEYKVVVLDNLSNGSINLIPDGVDFMAGDLLNLDLLNQIFKTYEISVVIHNAAKIDVVESMEDPLLYYKNNVSGTINLLEAMKDNDVKKIIFASTASVYGDVEELPVLETSLVAPSNVYGKSKKMAEDIIKASEKYGIDNVIFRFFNVGGLDLEIGRFVDKSKSLIGKVIGVLANEEEELKVFGGDFETRDGSAGRDFIHVKDIARAEVLAVAYLLNNNKNLLLNLSTGKMSTVREVIHVAEEISELNCDYEVVAAREGEIAVSYASADLAKTFLQWESEYALIDIIKDEWNWFLEFHKSKK